MTRRQPLLGFALVSQLVQWLSEFRQFDHQFSFPEPILSVWRDFLLPLGFHVYQ